MPAKFKKTQTTRRRTSRATRRTCKKGGMFRAASAATRRAVNNVLGKGLDRVDKLNQLREAIQKGVTQSQTLEKFQPAAMPRQFQFTASAPLSPLSPFRQSYAAKPDPDFKTPKKSDHDSAVNSSPPKIGTRARRPRETPEERRRRLGFSITPTMNNPRSIVVGNLFSEP